MTKTQELHLSPRRGRTAWGQLGDSVPPRGVVRLTTRFVFVLLLSCAPEARELPLSGEQLSLRSARSVSVSIRGHAGGTWRPLGRIEPWVFTDFQQLPEPPWDLWITGETGEFVLLGWSASTLDIAHLLPGPAPAPGPAASYRWPLAPGWSRVAITRAAKWTPTTPPGQPSAEREFLLLPLEEVTLLAGEQRRGRLNALHFAQLLVRPEGGTLPPPSELQALALNERFAFEVLRGPALSFYAELTFDGIATGIRLGEGLLRPPAAVSLPRPGLEEVDRSARWGILLKLQDSLPPLGEGVELEAPIPVTEAALHFPLTEPPQSFSWPTQPSSTPALQGLAQPGRVQLDAEPLLRWSDKDVDEGTPLGWVTLTMEAFGSCEGSTLTVIQDATTGSLTLPAHPSLERLRAAPMLGVSLRFHFDDGRTFSSLSEPALPESAWPRQSAQRITLGRHGAWRSSADSCDSALMLLQPDPPQCIEGERLRFLQSRCAVILPLPWPERAAQSCLPLRGGRALLEELASTPAVSTPPALSGGWHRAQLTDERGETLWAGARFDEPLFWVDSAGRLNSLVPALRWRGALSSWAPFEGEGELNFSGCRSGEGEAQFTLLEEGELVIEGRYPSRERWRLTLWRE